MKIALIDGHNLAFRAHYGMPELTREDGFPTGALHGWIRSLWWVEDHLQPEALLVFFDLGLPARQSALQEDYKANRAETPEALQQQLPHIKAWTRAMGYQGLERDGVEADDLIAAHTQVYAGQEHEVWIVSADKDLAQLVGPRVSQLLPPPTANPKLGWRTLDTDTVVEKFGVPPRQIPDYLALIGDTSDNIPGLAGVGPKTATKWLQQYGRLEQILAHSGELAPKRFQQLVHSSRELLQRNLALVTLDPDHPVEPCAPPQADLESLYALLDAMGMKASRKAAEERLARRRS